MCFEYRELINTCVYGVRKEGGGGGIVSHRQQLNTNDETEYSVAL